MSHIVVAYDISDNKTRRNIEKCLRKYGNRVNYSVFECSSNKISVKKIKLELEKIVDAGDDIRIYGLCKSCFKRKEIIGGMGRISHFKNDKYVLYI